MLQRVWSGLHLLVFRTFNKHSQWSGEQLQGGSLPFMVHWAMDIQYLLNLPTRVSSQGTKKHPSQDRKRALGLAKWQPRTWGLIHESEAGLFTLVIRGSILLIQLIITGEGEKWYTGDQHFWDPGTTKMFWGLLLVGMRFIVGVPNDRTHSTDD